MADTPEDSASQEPDTSQLLLQVRQLIGEINTIKAQAEAQLKQTEISRKNADSEALLAFNAKNACEGHATTIAGVKGAVEADANAIATNKQRSDEALASLTTARATVEADIKAIGNQRKEIDQAASTVTQAAGNIEKAAEAGVTKLKDIDASKESAENQLLEATQSAKSAVQAAADAASAQNRAEQSSTEAAASTAAMSEEHKVTTDVVEKTQALLVQAQAAQENLKSVLEHLTKSDEIATGHEKRVADSKG
jgi:chromosome segregation ATPase